jgi:multidrug efflux pump subunit AcrA (membrane-fusion protein)
MTIKEVLAKVRKGEALTDEEKAILEAYDPEKAANDSAAGARRKAELDLEKAKADLAKIQKDLETAKAALDSKDAEKLTETEKMTKELDNLKKQVTEITEAKAKAEAKAAATTRSQAIRDKAKAAGIALAPKTVSEGLFFQMLEATLSGVDVADEAAITAALDKFKAENPGVITAPGKGSGVDGGNPASSKTGKNPWAKDSFNLTEQVSLLQNEPDKARSLASEAGVKLD